MGTEVLRPQDILNERLRLPSVSRKTFRKQALEKESKKPVAAPVKNLVLGQVKILKRGEPLDLKKKNFPGKSENVLRKSFSEEIFSVEKKKENENLRKTFSGEIVVGRRIGPDPELVPIRLSDLKKSFSNRCSDSNNNYDDGYAGSVCYTSPSPRKLPLPTFKVKKEGLVLPAVDDSATKDLRRLLRID